MAKQTFLNLQPKKKAIFKEAVYQLFSSRAYETIGIRDITEAAGIALGGFYRYFDDKDEMFLDLFCEIESRLIEKDILDLGDQLVFNEVLDAESIQLMLTPLEAAFGETFYRLPDNVLYKYYFQGYAENVYHGYRNFFASLEERGGLKEGMNAEFAFYCYITSFFNFLIYVRRLNMNTSESIFRMKKVFFKETVMPGIVKPDELARIYSS